MGKIMYLEDQPDYGFIINVFGKVLSEKEIQDLKESENDPNELQKALIENPIFELVTDFSKALKKLDKNLNAYDLLIVDRDLYDNGLKYKPDNVIKTEPDFNETYHKREGDFLIGYCKMKNYDIDNRFYIFTGNTDELVLSPELKLILTDKFKGENIIVKGSDGKNKLIEIIDGLEELDIVIQNKQILNILNELYIQKDDFTKLFINSVKNKDRIDFIKDNLNSIRNILEAILTKTARMFNTSDNYWSNGSLSCSFYINTFLSNYNRTEDKKIYNFNTSSVIIEGMSSIYRISSQFGAHNSNGYKPSTDTVNSLLYALKDIIIWFGDERDRIKTKGKH